MGFDTKRKQRGFKAGNNRRSSKRYQLRRQRRNDELRALAPKFGVRNEAGRLTKLTEQVYQSICELLAEGNSQDCAATLSGIEPNTFRRWVGEGMLHPDGPFGQFACDVAYAKEISHRYLVTKIAAHDDWKASAFLLKNKFPRLYRDTVEQTIAGPEGGAIPISQTFSVVLELHKPPGAPNEQPPEPEFRIDPTSVALHAAPGLRGPEPGAS